MCIDRAHANTEPINSQRIRQHTLISLKTLQPLLDTYKYKHIKNNNNSINNNIYAHTNKTYTHIINTYVHDNIYIDDKNVHNNNNSIEIFDAFHVFGSNWEMFSDGLHALTVGSHVYVYVYK